MTMTLKPLSPAMIMMMMMTPPVTPVNIIMMLLKISWNSSYLASSFYFSIHWYLGHSLPLLQSIAVLIVLYSLCNESCTAIYSDDSIAHHSWIHCDHCTPLLYSESIPNFSIIPLQYFFHHSIAVRFTPFHCSTGQLVVPSILPTPTSYSHRPTKQK